MIGWLLRPPIVQPAPPFGATPYTRASSEATHTGQGTLKNGVADPDSETPDQAPEPAKDNGLAIQVKAHDGMLLVGVRVWLLSHQGLRERQLGVTGEGGILRLGIQTPVVGQLVVRTPGRASSTVDLAHTTPSSGVITITMQAAGVISGLLVDHEDRPLNCKGRVALWPVKNDEVTQSRELMRTIGDGAALAIVETDDAGRFQFTEAEPDTQYRFTAASAGKVNAGEKGGVIGTTASPEVRIPVQSLYAVIVRVRDSAGGPLELTRDDLPRVNQSLAGLDVAGFETVWGYSVGCQIVGAGVPEPGITDGGEFVSLWHLMRVRDDVTPLNFYFRAPGYEMASLQVRPQAVSEKLEEYVVLLKSLPRGPTGAMKVRMDMSGLAPEIKALLEEPLSIVGGVLTVGLTPIEGRGRTRTRDLGTPCPAIVEFDRVEVGSYRLEVFSRGRKLRSSSFPEIANVTEGGISEGSIRVDAASCLVLEIMDATGRPVGGRVSVDLDWGSTFAPGVGPGKYTERTYFLAPPYRIPFPPAGAVDIAIEAGVSGGAKVADATIGEGVVVVGAKCVPTVR
jgi:hypothetical protein